MRRTCLVLAILALGGCGKAANNGEPTQAEALPAQDAPEAPDAAPPTLEPLLGCTPPLLARIPDAPLAGEIEGRAFRARSVIFERGLGGWVLRVNEYARPGDADTGGQALTVTLPRAPEAGFTDLRPLSVGDGYWTAEQQQNMAVRRGTEAWAIEVQRWTVRPWDAEGPVNQDAGRASGRLAIVLQGDGGRCAWVAGRFDAEVRYVGPPLVDAEVAAAGDAPQAEKMLAPAPALRAPAPSAQQQVQREINIRWRKAQLDKGREAAGY